MLFSVNRNLFLEAISRLQRIVSSKSSLPVLEGILISAEKTQITLVAYNLEDGMKKIIPAETKETGDIVLNARLLSDILRKLNSETIEIESTEKLNCHLRGGEAIFDIMGMPAMDFPEMPSLSEGTKITLSGELFQEMIQGTLFAVAQTEGTRPILTGIDISVKDKILQFVAIDGYRLAIRREPVDLTDHAEMIINGRAVGEVAKLIDENTEEIEILIGKRLVSFFIDGYLFICRLMEGEFVNYQKTIPTDFSQCVHFNRSSLLNTVERVSLLINDSFSTPVRCNFEENQAVFNCATAVGRATEHFPVALSGEPFQIGLNSRYLTEALRAIPEDQLQMRFKGSNAGVVLCSEEEKNDSYLYMIMPMRLKNDGNN
ncbi:MAG: DNA polymerase III subunit beta [Clostridia bacterium]|nr:DNA polymerase III subunit beta [Clostridia bacterium]